MKTKPTTALDGNPVVVLNVNERRILADCRLLLTNLAARSINTAAVYVGEVLYSTNYTTGLAGCLDVMWAAAVEDEPEPPAAPAPVKRKRRKRQVKKKEATE